MSFEFVKKLPAPNEIKRDFPVPERIARLKAQRDTEIRDVITGKSDKFLAIIGPCSADNEAAVLDYTLRLKKVQEKIKDKVIIIPRVYTNKPRTTGTGYKGMLHQPDPEKKPDLLGGLVAIRKMHINVMEQTELMPADEMLYPENYWYLADVLSYVAVGARSVANICKYNRVIVKTYEFNFFSHVKYFLFIFFINSIIIPYQAQNHIIFCLNFS